MRVTGARGRIAAAEGLVDAVGVDAWKGAQRLLLHRAQNQNGDLFRGCVQNKPGSLDQQRLGSARCAVRRPTAHLLGVPAWAMCGAHNAAGSPTVGRGGTPWDGGTRAACAFRERAAGGKKWMSVILIFVN